MSHTTRYALSRIGQALLTVFLVYIVVFVIVTLLPGDPVSGRLSNPEYGYTADEISEMLVYFKLDRPAWEQLWVALERLLHGDLGLSYASNLPVSTLLWSGVPSTLQLAGTAFVIAIVFAAAVAVGAFFLPTRFGGGILRAFPSLFLSLPNFLIGLVVINVFSFQLGLFVLSDFRSVDSLIYPAVTLAIPASAPIAQVFISALDTARSEQYATVAVSKGIGKFELLTRHLLPNAALPTLTITAIIVGDLLGGSIITEAIFGRNGVGSVVEKAVGEQDVPVLQAAVVLAAVLFLAINLVVDLVYPVLDPRLRRTVTA
ncbi:ABC transporter permease [Rhodococcus sp. 15-649-1-2]|uniref:ABC transporter permease n=1 Tax=Rhodococcus sp. 114MFTsu3.1 TaxID=1172184 RepID=UPI000363C690|nr:MULTISPECIES: ABC transporter permease [unclassified Rhodococcus (in: high G+C Gram-positive bacteria)]OZC60199.1 ABC transporter permease [Rhodococcus sp. 06-621-2]OZC78533.1 ABC transporter permease [Rhodococcus sp. 06-418-1B]OZD58375.1 ABC transporter permease [Rhodococcus sp. 06-1059B-a]OZE84870.1 ABC transporter permease [Rhodococcus sp. 15-649-1-2]OZF07455.1 ABC transporter permease [Rhodococcus sp. 15-1154-1]